VKLRHVFGVLRGYIAKNYSRGGIKALLVESGCRPERMAKIRVSGDMKAPDYKSRAAILPRVTTRLEQICHPTRRTTSSSLWLAVRCGLRPALATKEQALIDALEADGIAVAAVLGDACLKSRPRQPRTAGRVGVAEASRLANKAVSRLGSGDFDGAVTVAVSR